MDPLRDSRPPVLFAVSGATNPLQRREDDEYRPSAPQYDPDDDYLASALAQNASESRSARASLQPSEVPSYTPISHISKHSYPLSSSNSVQVCDPVVREGGVINKFVLYTVRGKDTSGSFEAFRRYSDFLTLRNAVCRKWPGVYIPALPPKQLIGNRSAEFIEDRRVLLEDFLRRVMDIEFIETSEEFQAFVRGGKEFERECAALRVLSAPEIAANYTNYFTNYVNPSYDPLPRLEEEEKSMREAEEKLQKLSELASKTKETYAQFQVSYQSLSDRMNWVEETYFPSCLGRDCRPKFRCYKRDTCSNPYSVLQDWVKCELLDCRAATEAIQKVREMDATRKRNYAKIESEKADLQKLKGGQTVFSQVFSFKSRESSVSALESHIEQLTEETQSLGVIMRIASVRLIEYELPRVRAAKEDAFTAALQRFSVDFQAESKELQKAYKSAL